VRATVIGTVIRFIPYGSTKIRERVAPRRLTKNSCKPLFIPVETVGCMHNTDTNAGESRSGRLRSYERYKLINTAIADFRTLNFIFIRYFLNG